jgi:hypothetical protein
VKGFAKFSLVDGLCGEFGVFNAVGLLAVGIANPPSVGDCVGHLAQPFAVLRRLQDGLGLKKLLAVPLRISERCDQPLAHEHGNVVIITVKQPSRLRPGRPDRQVPEIQKLKLLVAHNQSLLCLFRRADKTEQTFLKNILWKN